VACKTGFFLPVRVRSRLFRRRLPEELRAAYRAGELQFFGDYAELADAKTFAKWLSRMGEGECVVYAKRPFSGPAAVLAYLSRYTHRVANFNSRLISMDETVTATYAKRQCYSRCSGERRLTERICFEAREAGHRYICLDTLPTMTAALQIYETLYLKEIASYVFNPIDGAIFLGLEL